MVEAARFLTLHFPYKIEYFYENGRLGTNGIDGEGRYYHKGLYLNSSKYSTISKSKNGPKVWGCSLYSTPVKRNDNNGLDCSGFVSWALLNGGQLLVASLIVENINMVGYLPFMLITSLITGMFVGLVSKYCCPKMEKFSKKH